MELSIGDNSFVFRDRRLHSSQDRSVGPSCGYYCPRNNFLTSDTHIHLLPDHLGVLRTFRADFSQFLECISQTLMDRWMSYCLERAKSLPYKQRESRVYAVVLDKKDRLVSESANSYKKTHPEQARLAALVGLPDKIFGHAELIALQKDRDQRGQKIVVARVDAMGNACYACPCPICSAAIREHGGIRSIVFSKGNFSPNHFTSSKP